MVRRRFKLTTLMLSVVLGVLFAVLVIFSLLSYSTAQKTIEREVARSFDHRNRIAEISLEGRLDNIDRALLDLGRELSLNQWSFAGELIGAETLLDGFQEKRIGGQLDVLAMVGPDRGVLINFNSPLVSSANQLMKSYLVDKVVEEGWQMVSAGNGKGRSYGLLNSVPVINPQQGEVVARLISGVVLNDNVALARELNQDANAKSLQLIVDGRVLATATNKGEPDQGELLLSDSRNSRFFEDGQRLVFRTYMENHFRDELNRAHLNTLVVLVLVILVAALVASMLIRRITTHGFGRLIDFAHRVRSSDDPAPFQVGMTSEFNTLGSALEEMVESVKDNELYLDALLEEAASPVILWDESLAITRINRSAESLFGISREESEKTSLVGLFSDSVRGEDTIEVLIERVIQGAPIQAFETVIGEGLDQHYLIWDITPIRYRKRNERQTYLAQGTDITEIIRADEALKMSEEQTRMLLNSTAEAILGIDLNGNCTLANPSCLALLGCETEEEIIGKNAHQLMHYAHEDGSDYPASECQIYNTFRSGEGSQSSSEVFWRKDGTSFPVEYWSFPIRRNGEIVGAVVSFLDITQRKKDEAEIRDLRNYLGNIIDSMPSVLVGVDNQGCITQWNREAQRVTGLNSGEVYGKPLHDVYPLAEGERDKIQLAIKHSRVEQDQRILKTSDGVTKYTDITIYPLTANGVAGAVIRVDDVSDRVRLEELMIQSEKMASVGGLAAGMAHEINNPLAGILQNTQVIRQRLSSSIPKNHQVAEKHGVSLEQVRAYVDERKINQAIDSVAESGRRASTIVSNMLSFSRKGDAEREPVALDELIEKTIELVSNDYDLRKKYDFRHLQMVREYQADLPKIYCEPTKIQQVLLNLFKNGAQAMLANPVPGRPPRFLLRLWSEKGDVCLEVNDNGPGMDEATRKRVYEPFFTTKDVGEGTGLGLAISYFLITEDHKGKMEVNSVPGEGASFVIRLPVRHD